MTGAGDRDDDADVIVVGAGPGGSAAAYHLARHGVRRAAAGEDRVPAGEGLRRRAHPARGQAAHRMGVDTSAEAGWLRNKGLRVIGGGVRLELDWPDLASFPNYGLVRTRLDFDDLLAKRPSRPARVLRTSVNVTGPVLDERRPGRRRRGRRSARTRSRATFRAPLVVAADGVSGRFPLALGLAKRDDRPIGRGRAPLLPRRRPGRRRLPGVVAGAAQHAGPATSCCPGYGWIFGMGDGRVNVGPGRAQLVDRVRQDQLPRACSPTGWPAPRADWGMCDEANADGPDPRARRCRWASTGCRTTPGA